MTMFACQCVDKCGHAGDVSDVELLIKKRSASGLLYQQRMMCRLVLDYRLTRQDMYNLSVARRVWRAMTHAM